MTGFHVDPDALRAHAAQVDALAADVGNGAAAEVVGAGQADFGVLIGNTIGYGVRALAEHFEQGLQAAHQALAATADGLRATADTYRGVDTSNAQGIKGSGTGL